MTWANDERGKPCKWTRTITLDGIESSQGRAEAKQVEVRQAIEECQQAVHALVESGEYVVIVEPEIVIGGVDESGCKILTARARVRWIEHGAKIIRDRNLKAMFDAVDDELANGPT